MKKPDNYETIKNEYISEGTSLTKLAKKYGVNRKLLSSYLKQDGITIEKSPKTRLTPTFINEVCDKFFTGNYSIQSLADELGSCPKDITKILVDNGLHVKRKKHIYKEDVFEVINTEEKAYWLGFLYADGCVETFDRFLVELTLSSKDKEHVTAFANFVSESKQPKDNEIHIKHLDKTFYSTKFSAYNQKLAKDLESKGCTPRKSLTLTFPDSDIVPEEFIRHFIRGYVDGDGSLGIYKKGNSFDLRLSINGTFEFLSGIQDKFNQYIEGYKKVNVRKTKGNDFVIQKGGKTDSFKVIDWIYNGSTIYLDRKYKIYQEMIAKMPSSGESR